jgi:VWFA-related protein
MIPCAVGLRSPRRALALVLVAIAPVLWPHTPPAQQQPLVERVEVARVLIDARVFDDGGRPISDLEPSDFAVKIDGRAVRVESAEWVGRPPATRAGAPEAAPLPMESRTATDANVTHTGPPGRLVVFLVQKDLEPLRIVGLMQMSQLVDTLLQPLRSDDRVAVLSFDSRLHIWTDFTTDFERVRSVLAKDIIRRHPEPVAASDDVSLMSSLNPESAGRIYGIEHALRRIAESLEPLPGAKSLVLLGYGFGRFNARTGDVTLMDGYDEASAALQRARVAVFTLNVTQANFNSLQAGLQTVAAETGGVYASTYEFPTLAIQRVSHALEGHYVLFVEKPELRDGVHRIEVRLTEHRGTVIARSSYVEER